jgi:hypothetical protein
MSRRVTCVIVGVLLLVAGFAARAQRPRDHPYLEGPEGPYHGRVVDAETGSPLAGAVVVAVWSRERVLPFQSSIVFHAVREVLTGSDGAWVLDGRDVEARAPDRTLLPSFDVYYPGYAAITSGVFTRFGGSETGDMAAGGTVRLPRLQTREDRRLRFPMIPATPKPFGDVPNLMRLINIERASLGLEPLYGE